jgi:hypothetical protein
MTVYIVVSTYSSGGDEILDVYARESAANARLKALVAVARMEGMDYNQYGVIPYDVVDAEVVATDDETKGGTA